MKQMKKRLGTKQKGNKLNMKRILSLLIVICSILSILPASAFAAREAVSEAADEVTSVPLTLGGEYGLYYDNEAKKAGGYTLTELKTARLKASDIPEFADRELLDRQSSVKRLKLKETGLSSLVYQNKDGTVSEILYPENIKYIDKDGVVLDKSNKLTYKAAEGKYSNLSNDIITSLPEKIETGKAIDVAYNDYCIKLLPVGSESVRTIIGESSIEYVGVFGSNTSLKYTVNYSGVKEDIILGAMPDTNTFRFELISLGLTAYQNGNSVEFKDENNEIKAYLEELFIYDSDGDVGSGSITLTYENGKLYYIINVENDFLRDAVYPVTIDPSVTYNTTSAVKDVEINTASTTASPSQTTMTIGTKNGYTYALGMKFPTAYDYAKRPGVSEKLVSAELYLSRTNLFTPCTLKAYRITTSWSETSTTMPSNILTNSYYVNDGDPTSEIVPNTTQYMCVDVTKIFKAWINGSANNGILVRNLYTSSTSGNNAIGVYSSEASTNQPYLVLRTKTFDSLPTQEDTGIVSKSIYMISYGTSYLGKNNTTPALISGNAAAGSTKTNSRYVNVNYCGNGMYTLSFIGANNVRYYLTATSKTTLGLTTTLQDKSVSKAQYWYFKFHSLYLTRSIINAEYNTGAITASGNSLSMNGEATQFIFTRIGLDVPLFRQENADSCGKACGKMMLKYFGITVAESQFDETYMGAILDVINSKLSSNGFSFRYSHISKPTNVDTYINTLTTQISNNKPVLTMIKSNSSGGGLPYTTGGHYLVVKAIFLETVKDKNNNAVTKYCVLLNDSFDDGTGQSNNHGEYLLTAEELVSYIRNHDSGWSGICS